jgi:hypothetical protein
MFSLEEISDDLGLSPASAQEAAHDSHHLGAVVGSAFAQSIGLHVSVKFREIARQPDQAQSRLVGARELSATSER